MKYRRRITRLSASSMAAGKLYIELKLARTIRVAVINKGKTEPRTMRLDRALARFLYKPTGVFFKVQP